MPQLRKNTVEGDSTVARQYPHEFYGPQDETKAHSGEDEGGILQEQEDSKILAELRQNTIEEDPSVAPKEGWYSQQKIYVPQDEGKIHFNGDEGKIYFNGDEGKIPFNVDGGKIFHERGEDKILAVGETNAINGEDPSPGKGSKKRVCGFPRKLFWVAIAAIISVIIVAAVVGGVVGARQSQNRSHTTPSSTVNTTVGNNTQIGSNDTQIKTSPILSNSGLTALQYAEHNVTHYRLYFQTTTGILQESAWDSDSRNWTVTNMTTSDIDVEMGSALACVVGYPMASKQYDQSKIVYYTGSSGIIYERGAPVSSQAGNISAWGFSTLTGAYTAATTSFLAAHWQQDLADQNATLNLLWQQKDASKGLVLGQYTSDYYGGYPWVPTNLNHSVPDGSTFALAASDVENYLLLYTASAQGKLQQSLYYAADYAILNVQGSNLDVSPHTPITVVTVDNTPLYTSGDIPPCSQKTPSTQLLVYASEDRSTLNAASWNCSSGVVGLSDSLQPVLKPGRSYLGLASHDDGKVYVMFDQGDGPEIEEWTVPQYAGVAWDASAVSNVTTR